MQTPTRAISNLSHYGCHSGVDDRAGTRGKGLFRGHGHDFADATAHSRAQFAKFQYGTLGAFTEMGGFFLKLLDPERYELNKRICRVLPDKVIVTTRRDGPGPHYRHSNVLGLTTSLHVNKSDVKDGYTIFLYLGSRNNELLFPEPGLQIPVKPGSMIIFSGALLSHAGTDWEGDFHGVLVGAVGEGAQGFAFNKVFKEKIPQAPKLEDDLVVDIRKLRL